MNQKVAHTVHIKYCGLKTVDDILCASECSVDYIGLMFYQKSPRFLSVQQALSILEQARKQRQGSFFPKVVGVFVDSSFQEIQQAIQYLNLDIVQLYSIYAEYMQFTCPYWVAMRVKELADITYLAKLTHKNSTVKADKSLLLHSQDQYNKHSHSTIEFQQIRDSKALIIDSYSMNAYGGTGEVFDWSLLKDTAIAKPYFIAGGITAENIQQALAYKPYGIDISSGIEIRKGEKSHMLMQKIAAIVQKTTVEQYGNL